MFLASVGCALMLGLTGCSGPSETGGAVAREPPRSVGPHGAAPAAAGSNYTLMQMNLCLSGLAGCYGKAAYPAVVEEAAGPDPRSAPGRGHLQRGLSR